MFLERNFWYSISKLDHEQRCFLSLSQAVFFRFSKTDISGCTQALRVSKWAKGGPREKWYKKYQLKYLQILIGFLFVYNPPVVAISVICNALTIAVYIFVYKKRNIINKCFMCYIACFSIHHFLWLLTRYGNLVKESCTSAGN